jgi:hypothetical protein
VNLWLPKSLLGVIEDLAVITYRSIKVDRPGIILLLLLLEKAEEFIHFWSSGSQSENGLALFPLLTILKGQEWWFCDVGFSKVDIRNHRVFCYIPRIIQESLKMSENRCFLTRIPHEALF